MEKVPERASEKTATWTAVPGAVTPGLLCSVGNDIRTPWRNGASDRLPAFTGRSHAAHGGEMEP